MDWYDTGELIRTILSFTRRDKVIWKEKDLPEQGFECVVKDDSISGKIIKIGMDYRRDGASIYFEVLNKKIGEFVMIPLSIPDHPPVHEENANLVIFLWQAIIKQRERINLNSQEVEMFLVPMVEKVLTGKGSD